jgi:hypothetical protein
VARKLLVGEKARSAPPSTPVKKTPALTSGEGDQDAEVALSGRGRNLQAGILSPVEGPLTLDSRRITSYEGLYEAMLRPPGEGDSPRPTPRD